MNNLPSDERRKVFVIGIISAFAAFGWFYNGFTILGWFFAFLSFVGLGCALYRPRYALVGSNVGVRLKDHVFWTLFKIVAGVGFIGWMVWGVI